MSREETSGSVWVNTHIVEKWTGAEPKEGVWDVNVPLPAMTVDPGQWTVTLEIPQDLGIKYDGGKPDYSLLPFNALEEVVKVLTYGAAKYSRDNWKLVEPHKERYVAAALRHLTAYAREEKSDPESGRHHLAHAATCLLYIIEKDLTGAK